MTERAARHQWWCGGKEPCACTDGWRQQEAERTGSMTERAQALEAAEPWREQLDRLRQMASPDGDWDLSDNDRAAIQAAIDRAVQPPPPVGSPTTDTRQDCTCLGTCRGAEGLGPRWKCALEKSTPVAPAGASESPSEMDSGIVLLVSAASAASGYLERQQPDLAAWLWNAVQLVLNSQSAPVSPVEPAGASEPPRRFVDPEPECPGPECSRCSGEYCDVHITDPCDCDTAERHASDIGRPTPVSPVAPEPPTCGARHQMTGIICELPRGHAENHRGEDSHCSSQWPKDDSAPTGAPAPCVWREMEDGEGKWRKTVMRTTCGLREDADEMRPLSQWPFCPQCGHPLTVER